MPLSAKQRRLAEKLLDRLSGSPEPDELTRRTVRRMEESSEAIESLARSIEQMPKVDGWEQVTDELRGLKSILSSPKEEVSVKELIAALPKTEIPSNEPVLALLSALLEAAKEQLDDSRKTRGLFVGGGNNAFFQDQQTWLPGQSSVAPMGGVFDDDLPILNDQAMATPRITGYRALQVNLRDANGNEIGAGSLTTPTTLGNGKKLVTTAGTRVQLAATKTVKSVSVKALASNTGLIYIGDTAVAAGNGFQLSAGDEQSYEISDLSTLWLDSSVNGEGVTFFWVN